MLFKQIIIYKRGQSVDLPCFVSFSSTHTDYASICFYIIYVFIKLPIFTLCLPATASLDDLGSLKKSVILFDFFSMICTIARTPREFVVNFKKFRDRYLLLSFL